MTIHMRQRTPWPYPTNPLLWRSSLPHWEPPPRRDPAGDGERRLDEILELVSPDGRRAYDMRRLVALVADTESTLELQPDYGAAMLTLLARLGGEPVAILANQPLVRAGAIDREAADNGARFLEVADAFHLPVIFLADNPGVMAGSTAERRGALRAGARLFFAQAELTPEKTLAPGRGHHPVSAQRLGAVFLLDGDRVQIGAAPERDDIFVAAGHFRMGVMAAPATGFSLAQLIVDGETDIDLSAMDPARFVSE